MTTKSLPLFCIWWMYKLKDVYLTNTKSGFLRWKNDTARSRSPIGLTLIIYAGKEQIRGAVGVP